MGTENAWIVVSECIVCLNPTDENKMFETGKCDHLVCLDCLRRYFNNALKDDRYTSYIYIECPSDACKETFESFKVLHDIFSSKEAEDWWNSAISSKAYIANKITCPMENCKAIFDADTKLTKECKFTECYECHRGFCMTCQTAWHPDVIKVFDDKEAEKKTLQEAERHNWRRCPTCGHLIERKGGCNTIYCRCGGFFCYNCGAKQCHCGSNHPQVNLRNARHINLPPPPPLRYRRN
ncbi:hypothetical protein HPULCUR_005109 [Helicostylum pulchrum]|uniref:RBR-type E3 ubiquitin transferase n=1 Tax=Helicostylum pulchrum TaxID=562976 RepID=A0ABP9XY58_9FUNG